jgi:hypothetical protein
MVVMSPTVVVMIVLAGLLASVRRSSKILCCPWQSQKEKVWEFGLIFFPSETF